MLTLLRASSKRFEKIGERQSATFMRFAAAEFCKYLDGLLRKYGIQG
jgi:hypothetical protein